MLCQFYVKHVLSSTHARVAMYSARIYNLIEHTHNFSLNNQRYIHIIIFEIAVHGVAILQILENIANKEILLVFLYEIEKRKKNICSILLHTCN